jgi:hypothetical protein
MFRLNADTSLINKQADRSQKRLVRLVFQLVFVVFLFTQVSRPSFWAGLMGRSIADENAGNPPGTRLIDPEQKPPALPAGMFLAAQGPPKEAAEGPVNEVIKEEQLPVQLPPDDDNKAIKTPMEDLPFLLESLVDLDRDLPPALYYHFLDKARQAPTERLLHDARRDVTFSHLYRDPREDPKRYRGQLVALSGTVRRALAFDIPPNAYGLTKRYEIWLFTEDSGKFPWVIELTELPPGFPLGNSLQEKVETAGFFLKLWAYRAQDGFRSAPVLLGRGLNWRRTDQVKARFDSQMSWLIAGFLGIFAAVILFAARRWYLEDRASRKNSSFGRLTDRFADIPEKLDLDAGVFPETKFDYIVHDDPNASASADSSREGPAAGLTDPTQNDQKEDFS